MGQILVIEDNTTMREGITAILSRANHEVYAATHGQEGVKLFEQHNPDFVITDLKMEGMSGVDVLKAIRERSPDSLVMIITAFGSIETAVEAMKLGAFDFITKPFPPDLLRMKVSNAMNLVAVKAENRFLRLENQTKHSSQMMGISSAIEKIHDQINKVAPTEATVLITGESGTGKELVARALHKQSNRGHRPFIKVDCSALAPGVLESELFGHERGAFTGATSRKPGRFELADGGTIFLDEIGEISLEVQVKLLRVLQDRCFERVGGTKTVEVNVRIISATNKDLSSKIQSGTFREDLYYRLHIVPIDLPPLRERIEDIPILVDHFLALLSRKTGRKITATPAVINIFKEYTWPGNIRELENLLERITVLNADPVLDVAALPCELINLSNHVHLEIPEQRIPLTEALERLERKLILRAYNQTGGVKTKTAQILGIKTSALYYKLDKYGITEK